MFGNTIDVLEEKHSDFGLCLTDEESAVKPADKKYRNLTLNKRPGKRWFGLG